MDPIPVVEEDPLQMEPMAQAKMNSIEVDLSGTVSVASVETSKASYIMKLVENPEMMKKSNERQCKEFLNDCGGDDLSEVTLTSTESSLSVPVRNSPAQQRGWGWFGLGQQFTPKHPKLPKTQSEQQQVEKRKNETSKNSPEMEMLKTKRQNWGSDWISEREHQDGITVEQNIIGEIPPLIDEEDCEYLMDLLQRHFNGPPLGEEEEHEMELLQKQRRVKMMTQTEIDKLSVFKEKRKSRKLLSEMRVKFHHQEPIYDYMLCFLELQELNWTGYELSAEERYELELLERHHAGEELYEEANDLRYFVEKRLMYKRLELDLQDLRDERKRGEEIDEDLLFVLELFERKRLQGPLDKMEKLALDFLERDRLGETLSIEEVDDLLDIMDIIRKKKPPSNIETETKTVTELMLAGEDENNGEQSAEASIDNDSASAAIKNGPWRPQPKTEMECLVFEARPLNHTEKSEDRTDDESRRGWLSYWRSQQNRRALKARNRLQSQLLNKSLQKAKLLMEIDNLKMDLKKANAQVLQLGGEKDENTIIILGIHDGLPYDDSASAVPGISSMQTMESVPKLKSKCENLRVLIQQKENMVSALEEANRLNEEKCEKIEQLAQEQKRELLQKEEALSALKVANESMDKRNQSLEEQICAMRSQQEDKEGDEAQTQESMSKLTQKYESLQHRLDDAELEPQHQESCSEMKDIKEQLQEAKNALKTSEAERDEFKSLLDTSRLELEATKKQVQESEMDSEATKRERDEIKSLHQTHSAELKEVERNLNEAKTELKVAVERNKEMKSTNQTTILKLEEVERQLSDAKQELEKAEAQRAENELKLSATVEDCERLTGQCDTSPYPDTTKARVAELLLEAGIESGSITDLVISYQALKKSFDDVKERVAAVKKEAATVATSHADLDAAASKCKELEEEISDLRKRHQSAEDETSEARKQVDRCMEDMTVVQDRVNFLSQNENILHEENACLLRENAELKELCEEMISNIQAPVDA